MRDVTLWSVSCGRGADVEIRLHASLFLASAVWLRLAGHDDSGSTTAASLIGLAVYLASLALHEWAHCTAVWRLGGRVERIVLGPTGGLHVVGRLSDARDELFVALAGPAANLGLAVVCTVLLFAMQQPLGSILFLFAPPATVWQPSLIGVATWGAWINLLLALVNLLPAFPLDGARAVAALLRERTSDAAEASARTARIGMFGAMACLIASYFVRGIDSASLTTAVLGISCFFCSRAELYRALAGDEFEDHEPEFPTPDESRPQVERFGPIRRWWQRRVEERRRRMLEIERSEEERADEILARLHSLGGREALSPEDRALLERVSARYRHRQSG